MPEGCKLKHKASLSILLHKITFYNFIDIELGPDFVLIDQLVTKRLWFRVNFLSINGQTLVELFKGR